MLPVDSFTFVRPPPVLGRVGGKARYRVRFDRTPPQNEYFQVCLLDAENRAHMHQFVTYGNAVEFEGPPLRDVSTVLVAPLSGEWSINHVELTVVASVSETVSDTHHPESHPEPLPSPQQAHPVRFVPYDAPLVEGASTFAFVREPAPREFDEAAARASNEEYRKRKEETLKYLLGFLAVGAVVLEQTRGGEAAASFLAGGITGVVYQLMLHFEVDRIEKRQLLVNAGTRLLVIAVMGAAIASNANGAASHDAANASLLVASIGFIMQKVALYAAHMTDT